MLASIKSDLRKLLTVRSTYFLTGAAMIIVALISFYAEGWKGGSEGSPAARVTDQALEVVILQSSIAVIILAIISILHIAHEYRYNTIMYTLTANVSRFKVLLSKMVSISIFALVFAAFIIGFSVACYLLGISMRDVSLPAQNIDLLAVLGRVAFYFVAYALLGLLIASIIRNLVGAIAFFFIVPNTIEGMLQAFWLKDNSKYLPFQTLDNVVMPPLNNAPTMAQLTHGESILLSLGYLAILGVVAFVLFIRRDVN